MAEAMLVFIAMSWLLVTLTVHWFKTRYRKKKDHSDDDLLKELDQWYKDNYGS